MTSRRSRCRATARQRLRKIAQDKGHRREIELTVAAMKQGKEAPISFAELMEVTEATFAIDEAVRTQKTIFVWEYARLIVLQAAFFPSLSHFNLSHALSPCHPDRSSEGAQWRDLQSSRSSRFHSVHPSR